MTFVGVAFLALLHQGSAPDPGLGRYVGRDLAKLAAKESAAFDKRLRALTHEKPDPNDWYQPTPHWIKRYRVGAVEWLLLCVFKSFDIPGMCSITTYAFDAKWRLLSKATCPTGYRLWFVEAKMRDDQWMVPPILTVKVKSQGPFFVQEGKPDKPVFHPDSGILETYSFDERGGYLIRMTTGDGKMLGNSYLWDMPSIGPNVCGRKAKAWKTDLDSADPVRQLACMVWLSGSHLNSKDWRRKGFARELVEDSLSYEALRADSSIHHRLLQLSSSKIPWVKEAADFAILRLAEPLAPIELPPQYAVWLVAIPGEPLGNYSASVTVTTVP